MAQLQDVRGAIHLHTRASDGTGTINTIAQLAGRAELDFVIITDHNTLAGRADEHRAEIPLVLVGSELSTAAGHLIALNISQEIDRTQTPDQMVDIIHAQGGLAIAAHPLWPKKPWTRWDLPLDGVEIFDFNTMLSEEPLHWLLVKALILPNPIFWQATARRPTESLALWDRELTQRPLTGLAGHGTHAHVGLGPFVIDSYQSGFRLVMTHLLVPSLTPDELYTAIRQGRGYIGFDGIANPRPFIFAVKTPTGWAVMGDRIRWQKTLVAEVHLPRPATVTLFRDGQPVGTVRDAKARWPLKTPGTYRVEAFLGRRPWVLSNPIYVEDQPLPAAVISSPE